MGGAQVLLFPTRTVLLYMVIPMPSALFGVLFLLRDLSGAYGGGGNVAHAGHLGGAAAGAAAWCAPYNKSDQQSMDPSDPSGPMDVSLHSRAPVLVFLEPLLLGGAIS
eukprot:1186349-Prorocentrum_minimum.AAC.2